MDHLRGAVVDDVRARARQRVVAERDRTVLGPVAPDGDRVVLRRRRRADGRVDLRVVQAGDEGEPVGAAVLGDRLDDRAARRGPRTSRPRRSRPRPGDLGDDDARATCRRRSRVRCWRASRSRRGRRGPRVVAGEELRLDRPGVVADQVRERGRDRCRIVHLGRGPDERRAGAARRQVDDARAGRVRRSRRPRRRPRSTAGRPRRPSGWRRRRGRGARPRASRRRSRARSGVRPTSSPPRPIDSTSTVAEPAVVESDDELRAESSSPARSRPARPSPR